MKYSTKKRGAANRAASPNKSSGSGKQKRVSSLDPAKLSWSAQFKEQEGFQTETYFNTFPLHPQVLANIEEKGYESLTKIQEQSLPYLLEGKDIVAISGTGSGKTAAFLIPIIEKALKDLHHTSALVVAPTRELALQIGEEFETLTKGLPLRSATFIGGTSLNTDRKNLQGRIHLHIGTPGRLLDLAGSKLLNLRKINTMVLDEFDKMLDMGFVKDIEKIVQQIGSREQTMLFSATVDNSQKRLIASLLNDPVELEIASQSVSHEHIEQETVYVPDGENKFEMLTELFQRLNPEKVILFTETKRLADRLTQKLNREGISAGQIHGDKSQNFRVNVLNKFKSGGIRVLVATDVAARGIDVSDVSHVINYQLPMTMDAYVHRIGRTGRAGKPGHAITFIN